MNDTAMTPACGCILVASACVHQTQPDVFIIALQEHVGDHLQLNDTPMTQALGAPSGASGGGDPTPHQSQIGGYGGEGSTPVATQDATAGEPSVI